MTGRELDVDFLDAMSPPLSVEECGLLAPHSSHAPTLQGIFGPPAKTPFNELLVRVVSAHDLLKREIDLLANWSADRRDLDRRPEEVDTSDPSCSAVAHEASAEEEVDLHLVSVADSPGQTESSGAEGRSECSPVSQLATGGRRLSRVSVMTMSQQIDLPPLLPRPGWVFSEGGRNLRGSWECKATRTTSTNLSARGSRRAFCFKDMIDDFEDEKGVRAWNPDSASRTIFDAVALLMLIYDAFVVPYALAWDEEEKGILLVCVWITRAFWTVDLPLNLITGYRTAQYRLELRPAKTALHYLHTALLPDCALVVMDWFGGLSSNSDFRPIRLLKLLRGMRQVIRAAGLMQKFKLSVNLKEVNMAMDIGVLLFVMCWVNHIVCCAWYGIGKLADDERNTWLSELRRESEDPESGEGSITRRYEYATSLHWAFTQMTPASMEVVPHCALERAFTVGIIFVGLVLGSSLIATITSIMTQYRLALEDSSKKFHQLQMFLSQQGIDPRLGMAIKMQVLARLREKQRVRMGEVHHLGLTSRSIRDMLKYHSGMRCFGRHAFLATMDVLNKPAMQSLISRTSGSLPLAKNDLIFEDGAPDDRMYFTAFGYLTYSPGEHAPELRRKCKGEPDPKLSPGDWCSEAALWTDWTHLGTLEATGTADVLWLAAADLQAELVRHADLRMLTMDYARAFQHFVSQPGTRRSDLVSAVDTQEIMSLLSHESRLAIASPVLEKLRAKSSVFSRNRFDTLEEEVTLGKCHIGHVDGELMRSVFVVAVRVQEVPNVSDGRFLAKIAEVPLDADLPIEPSCNMPGSKISGTDRDPYDVLKRLLRWDFSELGGEDSVKVDFSDPSCVSKTSFVQASPSFGIRTQYVRTTWHANFDEGVQLRKLPAPELNGVAADGSGLVVRGQPGCRSLCGGAIRRRSSSGSRQSVLQSEDRAVEVLVRQPEIIVIRCSNDQKCHCKLYLWLTDDDLAALTAEHAKPVLQRWLLQLDASSLRRRPARDLVVRQVSL